MLITADLSALGGCSDIPIKKLIYIIAPTADLSALDGFPDTQMKKLIGNMDLAFKSSIHHRSLQEISYIQVCCPFLQIIHIEISSLDFEYAEDIVPLAV